MKGIITVDKIWADLQLLFGLLVTAVVALIGIGARHSYRPEGASFTGILKELPLAVLMAVIAGGVGEYMQWHELIRFALAGTLAYLGPGIIVEGVKWLTREKK